MAYRSRDDNITFKILNRDVIKRLVQDKRVVLPNKKVNIPKDQRWNERQMANIVMRGIQNGESVQKIAESLNTVINRNDSSAIRNARTMVTSAENHGRLDSYLNLKHQGVMMKKEWEATPDDRVRPSHKDIDGEEQDLEKYFSNGCLFPGDGNGPPEEVWMCRCAMGTNIIGYKSKDGSARVVKEEGRSLIGAALVAGMVGILAKKGAPESAPIETPWEEPETDIDELLENINELPEKTREIPLSDIVTTTATVDPGEVIQAADSGDPIEVVYIDGEYYLYSGTETATAAYLQGKKRILAKVRTYNG